MKYCINYHRNFKNPERADEFTINYTKKNDALIDFLENFKDKILSRTSSNSGYMIPALTESKEGIPDF